MNIQAKILNKIVIQRDQVGFIHRMQGWFNIWKWSNMIHYINKMKDENHMNMSMQQKDPASIYDKNSQQKGIEVLYLNIIKVI